jgi:magnesium transporter
MITFLKNNETGLETLTAPVPNCWIHVVDPGRDEIQILTGLGVPQDYITYALDVDERARIEREDEGTLLILIRVPYYQGKEEGAPYITLPVGMILTQQYFVTISRYENDVIQEFAVGRAAKLSTTKRNRFLLRIMLTAANEYLSHLRHINRMVDEVEDKLSVSIRNNEVYELLKYQKSLVYFTTALKQNELTLMRLQRFPYFKMYPDDEDLLEDVIIENQQAIEMTNISTNILSSMMDTFASIISNNLNGVMKFLTSVTIVLSLPTLITSFFGMNVTLPFTDHPLSYLMIIGISLALAMMVILFFARRDWF